MRVARRGVGCLENRIVSELCSHKRPGESPWRSAKVSHFSSHKAPEQKFQQDTASSTEREYSPNPSNLARDILTLQRTAGNQAVTQLLQKAQHNSSPSAPVSKVPTVVNDVLCSPGQPLNAATRARMEPRFGHDFSQVRIHTDQRAAESARCVNAQACTVGRDVVFGAGQYAPETSEGQRLMAHELTHVVQQRNGLMSQGLAKTTLGVPGDIFEHEADAVANRIVTSRLAPPPLSIPSARVVLAQEPCLTQLCAQVSTLERRLCLRPPLNRAKPYTPTLYKLPASAIVGNTCRYRW